MIGRIELSDPLRPGRSTLVESENKSATPSSPSCAKRSVSKSCPSTGVGSILKSPECTISPAGVRIASATESGVEWVTRTASDPKRPQLDFRPGTQQPEIGTRQPVFGQAAPGKCKCYFSSINRGRKAPQQICERADMVFMCMRQDDPFDFEVALFQVSEIGQQQTDAQFPLLGKHYTSVDNDGALRALDHHEVEPDFTEPAQRHDSDWSGFRYCHRTSQPPPPCPQLTAARPPA